MGVTLTRTGNADASEDIRRYRQDIAEICFDEMAVSIWFRLCSSLASAPPVGLRLLDQIIRRELGQDASRGCCRCPTESPHPDTPPGSTLPRGSS